MCGLLSLASVCLDGAILPPVFDTNCNQVSFGQKKTAAFISPPKQTPLVPFYRRNHAYIVRICVTTLWTSLSLPVQRAMRFLRMASHTHSQCVTVLSGQTVMSLLQRISSGLGGELQILRQLQITATFAQYSQDMIYSTDAFPTTQYVSSSPLFSGPPLHSPM